MFLSLAPFAATADSAPWLLTVTVGRYTDQHYEDILAQTPLVFEPARLVNVALARPFAAGQRHRWEIEAQAGKYYGAQHHWEFDGVVIWRWTDFPWNRWLVTTAAVGDGLSYASVVPPLELASHTNRGAARLLNYTLIETTFAPPQARHWSLVVRVHHRSGLYGTFGGVHGGSTVIAVGVKFAF